MRSSFKRILSLILVAVMLTGMLSGLTFVSAAEAEAADYVPGIGDASNIKRDGPAEVDWTANWIWGTDSTSMHNWMCFRKNVELTEVPETAEARIAIDSRYWLWVNGEMVVYEGSVKRGPSATDTYFDTVDIASYLKKGTNTIAILGWYFGADNNSFSYKSSGKAGMLFEADLGGVKVATDGTWKVAKETGYQISPRVNNSALYRHAEEDIYYDATKAENLVGWYLPEFDDSAWETATVLGEAGCAPWNGLWQRSIPLIKWGKEILPYENPEKFAPYTETATTATVSLGMNLPYNRQFQAYLKVDAPAGVEIQIYGDGTDALMTYYVTKAGVQEFESFGWMTAQTVTYKIPAGVKVLDLGYRATGYNAEYAGSFTSEDEFFNRLWMESLWTLDITMRDTYMDCPDRERAQWWGDATNESQMTFYSLDPSSYYLYRKGVDTLINWRGATGGKDDRVLCTVVPLNKSHYELPMQQLAGVIGFWTYYQYTGERDFLEQVYEPAVTYLTCWTMNNNGLVNHRGGSWDWMDWGSYADVPVIENAWYYWACQRVLMMAEELGIEEDKAFLISRMESIKAAYPSLWTENGYYKSSGNGKPDDRGNALAVLSGLATPDQYEVITNVLVNQKNASPYMEKYVLDALYAMDKQDEALNRMKSRYTAMVNDKWTTLWELFGNPGSGTHNHAWSGGPLINLSGNVAGVAPDAPGYETYHVIPQLGYLNNIDCTVPSIKGDIAVSIDRDLTAQTYAMTLTSPEGTVARVAVPRFEGKNTVVSFGDTVVFADGKAAGTVEGVAYESNDDQYIYFNVQPGTWSLNASVKAAEAAETYAVTIDATAGGYVTVDGVKVETPYTASVPAGTQMALEAVADSKMELTHWSGLYGFDAAKVTLTVNDNINLTANFAEKSYSAYKVISVKSTDGNDVMVEVNGKKYELPFTYAVKEGENLTMTAVDGIGWSFANWQGDIFSANNTLTLENVTDKVELELQGAYKGNAAGNQSLGAEVTIKAEDYYNAAPQWTASNLTDGVKLNDGGMTTLHWFSQEASDSTGRDILVDGKLNEPTYITIDLGKVKAFDTFRIYPRGTYGDNGEAVNFIVDYKILVSNDMEDWKLIYEKEGQENPKNSFIEITFEPQNARYVKLEVSRLGQPHKEGWSTPIHRMQLSELEVYNYYAKPATGTVTIDGVGGTVLVNGVEQELPYTATYEVGTVLAVEPQNATNYKFVGWSGDIETSDVPVYLNVESDIDLVANFIGTQVKPLGISENLAKGKTVTSSAGDIGGAWKVSNLTDGVVQMPTGGGYGFSTKDLKTTDLSASPVELTLDFGANVDFNSVKFYPRNGVYTIEGTNCHFPTSFKVYVMMDGETIWREMASFTDVTSEPSEPLEVKFPLQNARYMKIAITKITEPASDEGGGNGGAKIYRVQMAEIEAYLSPLTPENLAVGGKITSNDSLMESATWSCANLLDGKLRSDGRNLTTGVKGFTSSNYGSPELANPIWINAALPAAQKVNQVTLYPRSDIDAIAKDTGITPNFPTKFDVQVKNAAGEYETVASVDYGSADYNINGAPQVVEFGKDVTTTDVRVMVYRLGQPTWDEKTGDAGAYRVQLCEFQVGYVPDANAVLDDVEEGKVTILTDTTELAEPAVFTAEVTDSGLGENGIIWSVENEDGTVSDIAVLNGTTGLTTTVVPVKGGVAYVVARMSNGLKTVAKTAVQTSEPVTITDVSLAVTGEESVTVVSDELTYTVSAKNMVNTATAELTINLSTDVLGDPEVTALNGWYVILQSWEDGVLTVLVGNNAGVTSEEYADILSITAPIIGEVGTANVVVTDAVVSAYDGEAETFVNVDLSEASCSTEVKFNVYDVNRDGVVNQLDLTRAQRWYGTADEICDVNDDDIVNVDDMILILNNYTA